MLNTTHSRIQALLTLILSVSLMSFAHADNDDLQRTDFIQVSGTGRVSIAPDKADLTLSVEVQAKSAETARSQAAAAMSALIKALKEADIADKDIQTRTVSLYPVYAPDTANKVSGYQLANQVAVIVRDISKISTIIDSAVTAGGNAVRVQGISFSIENPDSALAQARKKAFDDAKAKAGQYAGLASVKLGRVKHISEGLRMPPMPVQFAEISAIRMKGDAADSTPVHIGEQEVAVTVDVVFGID